MNTKVIEINNSNTFLNFNYFIITKGDGYRNSESCMNDNSLVCYLNYKKNVLIPADAMYEKIKLLNYLHNFDYLLIPHHCCKYEKNINIIVNDCVYSMNDSGGNKSISIKYKHPQYKHLAKFSSERKRFGNKAYMFIDKKRVNDSLCSLIDKCYDDIKLS